MAATLLENAGGSENLAADIMGNPQRPEIKD
jgi:hypothetical protein